MDNLNLWNTEQMEMVVKWLNYQQLALEFSCNVLVCGQGNDLLDLLQYLEDNEKLGLSKRMLLAVSSRIDELVTSEVYRNNRVRIVYWNNDGYEEELIENTLTAARHKKIHIAIDLRPSLRRLHRIYYIVNENGRILLTEAEDVKWKIFMAPLFGALSSRNISIEYMDLWAIDDRQQSTALSDVEELEEPV